MLRADDFPAERVGALVDRGYARRQSDGSLAPGARLMVAYASRFRPTFGELERLFGPAGDAPANTRSLLLLQLESIEGGDDALRGDVEEVIKGLTVRPERALKRLRELAEYALDEIVRVELPAGKVDSKIVEGWVKSADERVRGVGRGDVDHRRDCALPPPGQGYHTAAARVLDLLTTPAHAGNHRPHTTQGTIRLIIVLRNLGNYGVHILDYRGEAVSFEIAAAACGLGVELFRRLASELPRPAAEA